MPRTSKNGTKTRIALSLFSGAGGMDLGVAAAGFRLIGQVEMDPACCETLRAARARTGDEQHILERDIREVDPEELRRSLGLRKRRLDLLCGGPPCQSFSQIGMQKGLDDERGLLLFELPRFAAAFEPKAILIEQVKGLLGARGRRGERGEVLQSLLRTLHALKYETHVRTLVAADYGVPQLRKRVFIVAVRSGKTFEWPQPSHGLTSDPELIKGNVEPYLTVGAALSGLGRPAMKNGQQRADSHVDATQPRDRVRIAYVKEGSYLAREVQAPEEIRGRLMKKDTTKFKRLSRKEPALTLRCGEIFFHPTQDRYLTPREYMRIHGYPDEYLLCGPIRGRSGSVRILDQHRQVANSVPPPLAEAVAGAIRRSLDRRRGHSTSTTSLRAHD